VCCCIFSTSGYRIKIKKIKSHITGTMSSKPFSVRRALDNDFNLTIVFVVPLVAWAIYLLSAILGVGSQVILVVAVLISLFSPVALIWQLRKLRAFFEQGKEVPGELKKVYFFQDRGRIDYSYTYEEKKYSGSVPIHKTVFTRELTVGQKVTLVIDKEHPDRSLLLDLYS
jgi:hypothetical protein